MLHICSCVICEVRLTFENKWNLQVCLDIFLVIAKYCSGMVRVEIIGHEL